MLVTSIFPFPTMFFFHYKVQFPSHIYCIETFILYWSKKLSFGEGHGVNLQGFVFNESAVFSVFDYQDKLYNVSHIYFVHCDCCQFRHGPKVPVTRKGLTVRQRLRHLIHAKYQLHYASSSPDSPPTIAVILPLQILSLFKTIPQSLFLSRVLSDSLPNKKWGIQNSIWIGYTLHNIISKPLATFPKTIIDTVTEGFVLSQ